MDYKETIRYLYHLLPMYQNKGASAIKKDLSNITELCTRLEHPQNTYKTIHVGGTNGKGTVSHLIASVLQESGLNVGLYTSPHYVDFRERIKINGEYIPKEKVVQFVENQKANIEAVRPSFFELTVAMAFDHFRDQKVNIAVIEVGLGGRLDSTNIITPLISVITNIGLDHQHLLGDSIKDIATEKAGIIKNNVPVVIGEYDDKSASVFIKKSRAMNSSITFASHHWIENKVDDTTINLTNLTNDDSYCFEIIERSPFLAKNISTVMETLINTNISMGKMSLNKLAIIKGIEQFKSKTNYIGRWQKLGNQPDIIADSGHNTHALCKSIAHLKSLAYQKIHFVLGFVKDKDIAEILSLFPKKSKYYFAKPNISRGAELSGYINIASEMNLDFQTYITVNSALQAAKRCADKKDLIFIGGSSFVVGEVI